jgi:large subunit ribosomal protein L19
MKESKVIQELEEPFKKKDLPNYEIGDLLEIHTRIAEGDKERIQIFTGTLIAKRGGGLSETIGLYRVSHGSGVERVFIVHSPKIAAIKIVKKGEVRKSKLYYIRGASGKKAKIKESLGGKEKKEAVAVAAASAPEQT